MPPAVVAAVACGLLVIVLSPARVGRLRPGEPPGPRAGPAAAHHWSRLAFALAIGVVVWFATAPLGWPSVPLGVVAGVVSQVAMGRLQSGADERRQARLAAELPQVCDLLVVCLEAGLPLRLAAEVLADGLEGPMAERLAEVAAKVRLGVADERAWSELEVEPALAGLARELGRSTGSGVALASRLRALGLDARRSAFATAEERARKVGVSSVLPLMACFLPAFVLLGVLPIVGGLVLGLFTP